MQTIQALGQDDARRAIAAIRAECAARGVAVVIAVADPQGELLALLRMDGALVSSVGVAIAKAFTAARLRKPSRAVGTASRNPVTGFDVAYYGDPRYVGWAGGLPVLHDGTVVGAVSVSGLAQDIDEELAEYGVAAIEAAYEIATDTTGVP